MNCTAIITTFNRPEHLKKLVNSIRKYYKKLPIIVVDNGDGEGIKIKGVDYYKIPFDSGLSSSRNFAISKVKTEYILLLDDDFEFTKDTKIETLLKVAKYFDIVGGSVEGLEFNGLLELDSDRVLRYVKGSRGEIKGYQLYDIILNFFVAKTESIKKNNCWDDDLKLAEHTDFFLRAKENKLKITFINEVIINHNHENRTEEYNFFRSRAKKYMQVFMFKNNITKLINFKGVEYKLDKKVIIDIDCYYDSVTFLIKTFKRQESLERLLFSIKKYYPKSKIIIGDDGDKKFNTHYYLDLWKRLDMINKPIAYNFPFDSGISYGRNKLVEFSKTPYILILDDDFEFTEKTKIEKMIDVLESDSKIGVVGGVVLDEGQTERNFEHIIEKKGSILYHRNDGDKYFYIKEHKVKETDCVLNFALFRKDVFNDVKWDNDLKISEHNDFYLKMKETDWRVIYCPDVKVNHIHKSSREYKDFRNRDEFLITMMSKNGLSKIKYLGGRTFELKDNKIISYKSAETKNIKI